MLCFISGNENSEAEDVKCSRGPQVLRSCFTPMRNPVIQPITLYASGWQTVDLSLIVGRSARFTDRATLIVVGRVVRCKS